MAHPIRLQLLNYESHKAYRSILKSRMSPLIWIGTADGGYRRTMVVTGHSFQAVGCGTRIIIEKDQDIAVGLAGGLITLAAGLQAPC